MFVIGIYFFVSGTQTIVLFTIGISDSVSYPIALHRIVSSGAFTSVFINIYLILCTLSSVSTEIMSFCSPLYLQHMVAHVWSTVGSSEYLLNKAVDPVVPGIDEVPEGSTSPRITWLVSG